MTLNEFREKRNLSVRELAELIGVHVVSAYRYLAGELPNGKVLANIIRETGGLVGAEDFDWNKKRVLGV